MDGDRQKLIDRIRKLEAVQGRSPEEAEAFVARAAELAFRHQISRDEIEDGDRVVRSLGRTDLRYFMGNANRGVVYLYHSVAEVFGCAVLGGVCEEFNYRSQQYQRCGYVVLLGTEEDRELVKTLVETVLMPQMMRDVTADRPRSRMSYTIAWAQQVGERLTRQRDQVYAESGAVIFVDDELRRLTDDLTTGRSKRQHLDGESVAGGGAAGGRADLGGAKIDPGRGQRVLTSGSVN